MDPDYQQRCFHSAVFLEPVVVVAAVAVAVALVDLAGPAGRLVDVAVAAAFAARRPLLQLAAAVVVEAKQRTGEGSS